MGNRGSRLVLGRGAYQWHRADGQKVALRLSALFGNSAEFWLNAQRAVDLWDASQELKRKGMHIRRLGVA